ncbi:putative transcription factor kapC [Metarhizium anisopliae]|nr:putative transcription factor kapC [Metarhizium anisopliae]
MMPMGPPSGHSPGGSPSGPPNASIAPAPSSSAPEPGAAGDGRKAKRELSQSKRAAQNRAAQRKEGYIKKLEQQVRDYAEMEQTYKVVQAENYALREYVIHLQSRLIDTQGEYPPPPPNVNLSQSSAAQPPPASAPEPAPNPGVGTPLEAVAQAVAGLAAQEQLAESQGRYPSPEYKPEPRDEDSRTVDEINRQLHQQSEENPGRPADV